ncbi:hypothetical protein M758_UG047400 [Ceratodon purpureus]|nr:hypothetical protein M758_UG047400 [Ceratodon purpureus]
MSNSSALISAGTVLHISASLGINENASSDVPLDMEDAFNRIVPEVGTSLSWGQNFTGRYIMLLHSPLWLLF